MSEELFADVAARLGGLKRKAVGSVAEPEELMKKRSDCREGRLKF